MQALAEGEVVIGTRSVHIELVGAVERFLVPARGGQPQEKPGSGGQVTPAG